MIKRIDHIGVAVKSLADTRKRLEETYGAEFIVEQINHKGHYMVNIIRIGDLMFSILESTSPEGFVAQHIEKHGEGFQHLGVEVDNLEAAMAELRAQGIKFSNYEEIPGVRKEVLVSGRKSFGVILQVMEWLGEYKENTPEERMLKTWEFAH